VNDKVRKFVNILIQMCDDDQISSEEINQEIREGFINKKNHLPFRQKAEKFSETIWEEFGPTRKYDDTLEILCIFHEVLKTKCYITIEEIANIFRKKRCVTIRTARQIVVLCCQRMVDYIYENEEIFNTYKRIPDLSKNVRVLEYVDGYISQEL